jgi:hypothetical protein
MRVEYRRQLTHSELLRSDGWERTRHYRMSTQKVAELVKEILDTKPEDNDFRNDAEKIRWVIDRLEEELEALGKRSTSSRPPPRAG